MRSSFPELSWQVIEMLLTEKPYAIGCEIVGRAEFDVSGRQLLKILANKNKKNRIKG